MNRTELKLEAYCEGCTSIEPEVIKSYPLSEEPPVQIMCVNRGKCLKIAHHILRMLENEREKENVRSEE